MHFFAAALSEFRLAEAERRCQAAVQEDIERRQALTRVQAAELAEASGPAGI